MESLMPQQFRIIFLMFTDDYIIEEMRKGKSEQEVLELLGDLAGNCENHCRCK